MGLLGRQNCGQEHKRDHQELNLACRHFGSIACTILKILSQHFKTERFLGLKILKDTTWSHATHWASQQLWWCQAVAAPSSVQFSCSVVSDWDPIDYSTPGLPVCHQLPEFTQTHVHWVGDAIQPSYPLSFPSPPALNLSQHQGLLNQSVPHIRWPKYWNFSFSISPSNKYSGFISFRTDCPRDSQECSPAPQFESINS